MGRSLFLRGTLALLAITVAMDSASGQGLLERLEKRLEGVLAGEERTIPPPATPVEAGYLGLTGDDDEAGRGVVVLAVRGGGPAAAAGFQAGDVIVAAGGTPVTKLEDLESQLEGKLAGNKIDFKINRGGKQQAIAVTLGRRPAPLAPEAPVADPLPPPRSEAAPLFPATRASLGVTVLPVTDEARRRHGLTVRQGALISVVAPGGSADRAGLPIGGVVVAADGRRIDQPDDLIAVVKSMRPGESLLLSYYQGGTLYRKSVKLAEAPGEGRVVAGEEPAPDRPLLRRIEKAIEGVAGTSVPFIPESGDLRGEVTRLQNRVAELERRLAEMEGRLEKPAAKPKDDGPALNLNPAEPPPRPEPEEK